MDDNEYEQVVITAGLTIAPQSDSDSATESYFYGELEAEKKYIQASRLLTEMRIKSREVYDSIFDKVLPEDILQFIE